MCDLSVETWVVLINKRYNDVARDSRENISTKKLPKENCLSLIARKIKIS